ncbi:MAG: serine/threonine protein kinase [Planctomycetaceae bacterium]|nr:serine/threonine protein kinase [Planctomycetaceae bacterium]
MTRTGSGEDRHLTRQQLLQIESICDRFERDARDVPSDAAESLYQVSPTDSQTISCNDRYIETYVAEADLDLRDIVREELQRIADELCDSAMALRRTEDFDSLNVAAEDLSISDSFTLEPPSVESQSETTRLKTLFGERFDPIEQLGAGTYGKVWKVRDRKLNRTVAIKFPHIPNATSHARFLREARAASRLDHPGIVRILELNDHHDTCFLLMEYVDGPSLSRVMRTEKQSHRQIAVHLRSIADALAYAHGLGVIHRDLKPQNILFDLAGRIQIVDFGLAKDWCDADASLTASGMLMGTPAYMAPEQVSVSRCDAAPTLDVYALGVVLYEMLTGELPFRGSTDRVLYQLSNVDPVRPRLLNPSVPEELETICCKCLEKRPEDRFRSMADLRDELTRYLDGMPIHSKPPGSLKRLQKWAARNRGLAAAAASAATLGCITIAVSLIAAAVLKEGWNREHHLRVDAEQAKRELAVALQDVSAARDAETKARISAQNNAETARQQAVANRESLRFIETVFQDADPLQALLDGQGFGQPSHEQTTLSAVIDAAAARIGVELMSQPAARAHVLDVIGNAYRSIGQFAKAETAFSRSGQIRDQLSVGGPGSGDTSVSPEAVHHWFYLGRLAHDQSRWDQAEDLYRRAIRETEIADERSIHFRDLQLAIADIEFQLGKLNADRGEGENAAAHFQRSLEIRTKWLPADSTLVQSSQVGLAMAFSGTESEQPLRELLSLPGQQDWLRKGAHLFAGATLHRRNGELDDAILEYESVIEIVDRHLSDSHPIAIFVRADFAGLLYERGVYKRALPVIQDVLQQADQICTSHRKLLPIRLKLAFEFSRANRFDEARQLYNDALRYHRPDTASLMEIHHGLAFCDLVANQATDALKHIEFVWDQRRTFVLEQTAWYAHVYALALKQAGRESEAVRLEAESYDAAKAIEQPLEHPVWAERIAVVFAHNNDFDNAVRMNSHAVRLERMVRPADHPRLADRLSSLAFLLQRQGSTDAAVDAWEECLSIREMQLPLDDIRIQETRNRLSSLKSERGVSDTLADATE